MQTSVMEFDHATILEDLKLTEDQFTDLCILCGCDYTDKIGGIGPVRALQLIEKHGSLDKVLDSLDKEKYKIPEPFPYKEARQLFKEPDVLRGEAVPPMKWTAPDTEGLLQFLVQEHNFSEERIRKAIERIVAAKGKSTQGGLRRRSV
jgi:flap endonuclease-1